MDKPINTQKKVPAIRFQGFSGEWEERELKDICEETYGGGTPSTSQPEYWGGDIPWIQSSDIVESNIKSAKYKKSITKMGLKKSASKLVPENSLAIVTRVGVGKVSLLNMSYATSQDFLSLSRLNIDYLYSAYAVWRKMQSIKLVVQGTSIKGITKDELLDEVIEVPKNPKEQTQIGVFFQALDDLIAKREQKHAKLRKIKQALLGKLFPQAGETLPQMRFVDFSGDWEEKTLGEIGCFYSGRGFPESEQKGKYGIPYLKVSDMNIKGNESIMNFANNYVNKEQISRLNYKIISEKSIIFAKVGAAIFLERKRIACNFLIDNNMMAFSTMENMFFTKNWFDSIKLSEYTKIGALPSYNESDLKVIEICIPTHQEQTQIGNLFQRLDTLIDQYQQQITTLKNIKQGYLNKMFIQGSSA